MPVQKVWNGTAWEDVIATPANMATTNSSQVITGIKTFPPNTLLMRSADGTQTAEPYSDVNAPSSFEMTQGTAPTTPTTGEAVLWTPDSKSLFMKAPDGTTTTIGPAPASTSGPEYTLTTEHNTTTPTPPVSGTTIFARRRARAILSTIGPSGLDTAYQPALFSNRIMRVVVTNGVAAPVADAISLTNYTAPALITAATTNFYTSMVRNRYSSSATAGNAGGFRSTNAQWFTSTTANMGGFFFVCRFGIGVSTPTNRVFVGMSPAALTNVNPSTLVNSVGFGCDTSQTTLRFITNNATANTANHVDLGANFPSTTAATWFFEARVFIPSGSASAVHYSITRLNDNINVTGTVTAGIPVVNTLMMAHVWHNNGTTAAAASIDLQSLYIETDN